DGRAGGLQSTATGGERRLETNPFGVDPLHGLRRVDDALVYAAVPLRIERGSVIGTQSPTGVGPEASTGACVGASGVWGAVSLGGLEGCCPAGSSNKLGAKAGTGSNV